MSVETTMSDVKAFLNTVFGDDDIDDAAAIRLVGAEGELVCALDPSDIMDALEPADDDAVVWTDLAGYEADSAVSVRMKRVFGLGVLPEEGENPENVLPPSLWAVHADGRRFAYYLLRTPIEMSGSQCDLLDDVMRLFCGDAEWDLECPLPGRNGWRLEGDVDAPRRYTIEDIHAAFCGRQDSEEEDASRVNDAVILGEIDEAVLRREVTIGFSGAGRQTPDGRWKQTKTDVGTMIEHLLSKHVEGPKDGMCFLQGGVVEGARRANAVTHLDLLVLDLDTGESIERAKARLKELGLFAVVYTTHSHLKATTEIKRDALLKAINRDLPKGSAEVTEVTLSHIKRYLRDVRFYRPEVLEGLSIENEALHTKEGIQVVVRHKPMPKFRVLLVLDKPFVISKRGGTQKQAIDEWKERYVGASKLLGAYFDRSCVDPSRLFYTPRHPKGGTFSIEVIPGRMLDIEKDVDRIPLSSLKEMSAWDVAAQDMADGNIYKTANLKAFAAKYAERFEVTDFFNDVFPEWNRGPAPGGGFTFRCPNDDAHSNAGDEEDKGFYAVNATDAPGGSFIAKCQHNSCADLDRLNYLDLVCQEAGIEGAMELKRWCVAVEGDDEEEESEDQDEAESEETTAKIEGLRGKREAENLIEKISKGEDEAAVLLARRIARTEKIKRADAKVLLDKLAKKSGTKIGTLKDAAREEEQEIVKERGDNKIDEELLEALERFNKEYAFTVIGGKGRVMRLPKAGDTPVFMEMDTFKTLHASERHLEIDADGKVKPTPITKHWLEWKDRKTFPGGVVFEPERTPPGAYNLWQGFPIKPRRGDWSLLRGHVFENICHGQEDWFSWLMLWCAQMYQQPGRKLGSSVVVKGTKGTGKSKFFDWLRYCMGAHATKISHRNHLVGNFNAHLQGKILVTVEEAIWAGDHASGGVLKDLITSDETLVEQKGFDPIPMSNYCRIGFISNEDWVVPAGFKDERRFFVLETSEARKKDIEFFAAVDKQMESGGAEAMLAEFLSIKPTDEKLGWSILRLPPQTPWLAEQAQESTPQHIRWALNILEEGMVEAGDGDGFDTVVLSETEPTKVPREALKGSFTKHMLLYNRHQATNRGLFLRTLEQVFRSSTATRLSIGRDRPWGFVVPPLRELRRHASQTFGATFDEDGET